MRAPARSCWRPYDPLGSAIEEESTTDRTAPRGYRRSALALAADLFPLLSGGLTSSAAERICAVLRDALAVEAFLVNGPYFVLSSCGEGMDHHVPGEPYRTRLVGRVIAGGETAIARTARSVGCVLPSCSLTAGAAVPLVIDGQVVGVLAAWRTERRPMSHSTLDMLEGLAGIFAARLAEQRELAG